MNVQEPLPNHPIKQQQEVDIGETGDMYCPCTGTDHSNTKPSQIGTLKDSDFKWLTDLRVWIPSPHCNVLLVN